MMRRALLTFLIFSLLLTSTQALAQPVLTGVRPVASGDGVPATALTPLPVAASLAAGSEIGVEGVDAAGAAITGAPVLMGGSDGGTIRNVALNAAGQLLAVAATELPAAAVLSDAFANPTAPAVGSFLMGWDNSGGTWDRLRATSARLAIDFDLIGGSQVSTGVANVGTAVQTVYLASNPTPVCADVDVSDAADTATLAAAAGRRHAMIQVEYGETDGPVQCGMGAASANGFDLEPAADATSTGGSWAIEGYSGAITCRSASGTVTVHACGW